jgi:hypothetical protein
MQTTVGTNHIITSNVFGLLASCNNKCLVIKNLNNAFTPHRYIGNIQQKYKTMQSHLKTRYKIYICFICAKMLIFLYAHWLPIIPLLSACSGKNVITTGYSSINAELISKILYCNCEQSHWYLKVLKIYSELISENATVYTASKVHEIQLHAHLRELNEHRHFNTQTNAMN